MVGESTRAFQKNVTNEQALKAPVRKLYVHWGLRCTRYWGLEKTSLQRLFTVAALNLKSPGCLLGREKDGETRGVRLRRL
jgi:hypothetical protein